LNSVSERKQGQFLQSRFVNLILENQLSEAGVIIALICPTCPENALLGFQNE
jgi:hypothetical protein